MCVHIYIYIFIHTHRQHLLNQHTQCPGPHRLPEEGQRGDLRGHLRDRDMSRALYKADLRGPPRKVCHTGAAIVGVGGETIMVSSR